MGQIAGWKITCFRPFIHSISYLCNFGLKHIGAMLGSNLVRNRAETEKSIRRLRHLECVASFAFLYPNALKNPAINLFRLFSFIPQWQLRFFFKSENTPSIKLLVFGIPVHSSCWNVKRYGRKKLRLFIAVRSLLCVYRDFPVLDDVLRLESTSFHLCRHWEKRSLNSSSPVQVSIFTSDSNSLAANSLGFLVRYLLTISFIWYWHICSRRSGSLLNRPFLPSIMMPRISNPRFSMLSNASK